MEPRDELTWSAAIRAGMGAGLFGGAVAGFGEMVSLLALGSFSGGGYAFAYAGVFYGMVFAVAGVLAALLLALVLRRLGRGTPGQLFAGIAAAVIGVQSLVLSFIRVPRDVFDNELSWGSGPGVVAALVIVSVSGSLGVGVFLALRAAVARRWGRHLMRPWVVAVAVVGVGLAVYGVGGVATAVEQEPSARTPSAGADGAGNVLMIVVDTLRADRLSTYGYAEETSPHLDAFAEDAIRFDQAFANASWTRPSFASILTGRYPSSHGVMASMDALPDALPTLAESFREGGHYTAGFVTNFNIGPYFNYQQGFDEYHFLEPDLVLFADEKAARLAFVEAARDLGEAIRGGEAPGAAYRDAATVNAELGLWLDDAPEAPWFLFAVYMDPHDPYFAHPYAEGGYARSRHGAEVRPSEAPALSALYDGEIRFWDRHFGELIASLKDRGLYDDLTIVVTSDHGEEFMEHGGFWHGTTLYDEQIRVPLLVKLPDGSRGGTVVGHWVQSVDLMPTLLRLSDLPVPDGVQGGDLFEGTDRCFAEESYGGNVLRALRLRSDFEAQKLIEANVGNPRGLSPSELYAVEDDPGEERDLARERPEAVAAAAEVMSEVAAAARAGQVDTSRVDLDAEAAARLKAIGYVDGE